MNSDKGYNTTFLYDYLISESYEWRWTSKIRRRCLKKIENLEGWTWITGKILEIYVWWNIRDCFERNGYVWRREKCKKQKTYYIKKNYQIKRRKRNGGIDLFVSAIDENGYRYYCKIECSNWRKQRISLKLFKKKISSKHKRYSSSGLAVKCEVIPYHNLEEIREKCENVDIIIIPIEEQFTEVDLILEEFQITKKWENISTEETNRSNNEYTV